MQAKEKEHRLELRKRTSLAGSYSPPPTNSSLTLQKNVLAALFLHRGKKYHDQKELIEGRVYFGLSLQMENEDGRWLKKKAWR